MTSEKLAAAREGEEYWETCEKCCGNGEIVTDWERYLHGPLDENGDDAVAECPDCNGDGLIVVYSPSLRTTTAKDDL